MRNTDERLDKDNQLERQQSEKMAQRIMDLIKQQRDGANEFWKEFQELGKERITFR